MADTPVIYGAGGAIYVGPGGKQEPAPEPVAEEVPTVPTVTVEVIEDDTPLSDEQVVKKAKGTEK